MRKAFKQQSQFLNVFIEKPNNQIISLTINSDSLLESIKISIQKITGIPLEHQILFYENDILDTTCTLQELQIRDEAYFKLRIKKLQTIFIKDISGRHIEIDVKPTLKVEKLKQLIYAREGIPVCRQRLIAQKQIMNDELTLADYGILPYSTIIFLPLQI